MMYTNLGTSSRHTMIVPSVIFGDPMGDGENQGIGIEKMIGVYTPVRDNLEKLQFLGNAVYIDFDANVVKLSGGYHIDEYNILSVARLPDGPFTEGHEVEIFGTPRNGQPARIMLDGGMLHQSATFIRDPATPGAWVVGSNDGKYRRVRTVNYLTNSIVLSDPAWPHDACYYLSRPLMRLPEFLLNNPELDSQKIEIVALTQKSLDRILKRSPDIVLQNYHFPENIMPETAVPIVELPEIADTHVAVTILEKELKEVVTHVFPLTHFSEEKINSVRFAVTALPEAVRSVGVTDKYYILCYFRMAVPNLGMWDHVAMLTPLELRDLLIRAGNPYLLPWEELEKALQFQLKSAMDSENPSA